MTENKINNKELSGGRSRRLDIAIAAVVVFVCCLALPFASTGTLGKAVGIVTTVVCSAFSVRVSSKKIPTVMLLLALFATFGLSNGLPFVTIILASTVGCGALAWLISKTESPYLAVIPALAYAISTVVTKSWFGSLLTLLFVLPAIILAQTYEKMNARVGALLRVTVGYLAFIVMAIAMSILYFTGEFRLEIIGEVLDGVKESLVRVISSVEITLVNGTTERLMSETAALNYVSQLISLLPALIVVLCNLFAYVAQKIQFAIFRYSDGEEEFNDLRRVFVMSPASAVVFILAFLIYSIAAGSPSNATLSTVCANLYFMFMPGLAFMGIKTFLSGKSGISRSGCGSGIITVMFIFLLLFNMGTALVMAACFGAFFAIEIPIRKYMSKKDD